MANIKIDYSTSARKYDFKKSGGSKFKLDSVDLYYRQVSRARSRARTIKGAKIRNSDWINFPVPRGLQHSLKNSSIAPYITWQGRPKRQF